MKMIIKMWIDNRVIRFPYLNYNWSKTTTEKTQRSKETWNHQHLDRALRGKLILELLLIPYSKTFTISVVSENPQPHLIIKVKIEKLVLMLYLPK